MPSRSELVLRAASLNVDHTLPKYQNDSVLEQAVIYASKQLTASSTATTTQPPVAQVSATSGGANV